MVLNLPLEEKPSKDGAPVREALRIIGVAGPNYGEFADVHPDRSFSLYFNLNREATLFEERLVEKERAYQGCDLEGDVFTIHAQASSLPRDIEVITSLLQSCEAAARNQEIIAINKFNEVKRVVKDLNSEIAPAPKHTL